ncbi:hypothetical protein ACOSP7_001593 [Xanthoceras sorbifolium]
MQETRNNSYPLGICQRLFNFIMNGLIASGFKRVTLGQPAVAAGSVVEQLNKSPSKLNDGEVMPVFFLDRDNSKVDFVELEGLESWTPVGDEFGSPIYGPRKDDAVLQSGKIKTSTRVKHQEPKDKATEGGKKIGSETPRVKVQLQGRFLDIEPNRIPVARPRGLKRTTTVEDSAEEEKRKSKGKSVEAKETDDQGDKSTKTEKKIPSTKKNSLTLATKDEEIMKAKTTPSPRSVRPFLGNINEKSDAFIRTKKEALSRNQ